MNRIARSTAALALGLSAFAPMAQASGPIDPTLEARVTAEMTAQGYEVRKIDSEDGMIEVYAIKDGKTVELYLDADLKIVKTKGE